MPWQFHKMHGAGNDFLLLDGRAQGAPELDAARVAALADRHRGVGFDQALVLHTTDRSDVRARIDIWNADGGRAEQCGNGMRCIGLYLDETDRLAGTPMTVQGPVADYRLQRTGPETVSVSMGQAAWEPDQVPLSGLTGNGPWTFRDGETSVSFGALSLGNPHAVIEVDDVDSAPLESLGRALRDSAHFPEGCNVGFAQVLDPNHIRLRVLERGAGETLACGSGACAAAAWLAKTGRVNNSVAVLMAGGELGVESNRGMGPITLTGPAAHVYLGTIA